MALAVPLGQMESQRQQKVARTLQKVLGEILQKQGLLNVDGALITLTTIRMTPDLGIARIHLSVMGGPGPKVLERFTQRKPEIRNWLGKAIRHQFRIVPDLEFFLDDTLQYVEKMDQIFEDLHRNEPDPGSEESSAAAKSAAAKKKK